MQFSGHFQTPLIALPSSSVSVPLQGIGLIESSAAGIRLQGYCLPLKTRQRFILVSLGWLILGVLLISVFWKNKAAFLAVVGQLLDQGQSQPLTALPNTDYLLLSGLGGLFFTFLIQRFQYYREHISIANQFVAFTIPWLHLKDITLDPVVPDCVLIHVQNFPFQKFLSGFKSTCGILHFYPDGDVNTLLQNLIAKSSPE